MAESNEHSVTHWISAVREGDEEAARQLWDRYSARVVNLARQKLGDFCRRAADEEDVAQSVFRRLYEETKNGGFEKLGSRDDLWNLLIVLTSNRSVDQKRYLASQKRGGGKVRGESVFVGADSSVNNAGLEGVEGDQVPPAMVVEVAETHDWFMDRLEEDLAQIARWRLEEVSNEEIAKRLGITSRSVRRKLERIREIWLEDNASTNGPCKNGSIPDSDL